LGNHSSKFRDGLVARETGFADVDPCCKHFRVLTAGVRKGGKAI